MQRLEPWKFWITVLQVSIRFYPETLVIASYLRVFFTECPPKSCLEYFGPFWRKNMVSKHSPKNYVFAVFNFVPLHYPKNFSTERGVLNNTLPANIIYKSELRLILQVIYVFRNQKHKSISQQLNCGWCDSHFIILFVNPALFSLPCELTQLNTWPLHWLGLEHFCSLFVQWYDNSNWRSKQLKNNMNTLRF